MFKKLCLMLLSVCVVSTVSFAGGKGTTSATFLKVVGGARLAALGGAYGAVSGDIDCIGSNPAGLASLEKSEVTATYAVWFQEINYQYLAYAMPTGAGTFGLAINMLGAPGMDRRDANGDLVDTAGNIVTTAEKFGANDSAITLSYSKSLGEKMAIGVNVKSITQKIDDKSGSTIGLDIGGLYKLSEKINLGLALQNVGGSVKFLDVADPIPTNLKIGSKYQASEKLMVALDINIGTADSVSTVNLGTQYTVAMGENMALPLRLGYRTGIESGGMSGISLGLGFELKKSFGVDFTWAPYGDLGDTIRAGLGYKF
ncbi:MAG: hypothetical protein A2252_10425 [Elusimicrobia bacterium RIFOXYA2_FULL_39_19]|nr:MAG: hypothetical protein A2252_10425 [Elusimicrobia bacterium RIFOXYA2_FULL_39_19]